MGVDIVSCGTGKRDPRIANPGPYRAYLGQAFLGRMAMWGRETPSIPDPVLRRRPPLGGARSRHNQDSRKPVMFEGPDAIFTPEDHQPHIARFVRPIFCPRECTKKDYLLICTTFAGGNPLKYVDEAIE